MKIDYKQITTFNVEFSESEIALIISALDCFMLYNAKHSPDYEYNRTISDMKSAMLSKYVEVTGHN